MNEWIIIAIIGVVLLFSAKKLPDMARGLGQSMRIFKAETRGMREDEQAGGNAASPPPGEIAPGRVAGPVEPGSGPAPSSTPSTSNGSTDGAPRAGS